MYVSELVKRAGNRALIVNAPPPYIDIHLTEHGSDWLWAVFALFALSALIHATVYVFTKPINKFETDGVTTGRNVNRLFFIYPLFIHAVLAYTYFTYASNLGYTSTQVEFNHVTTSENLHVRQVFYVKYIGWFLAWPFVLTIFEISTHTLEHNAANWVSEFVSLFLSLITKVLATSVFVLGLLIGALIPSSYRWGYFTFSLTAQLFAIFLVGSSVIAKRGIGQYVFFLQFIIWILYPIAWGLSEGGNVIQPDSEAVFYGVLDLFNFLVIPTYFTWQNVRTVDGNFFSKLGKNITPSQTVSEKELGETPRHSGDTAVPPLVAVPVAETEVV